MVPANLLNAHRYFVSVFIVVNPSHVPVASHNVIAFEAYDREFRGLVMGVVRPSLAWQTDRLG